MSIKKGHIARFGFASSVCIILASIVWVSSAMMPSKIITAKREEHPSLLNMREQDEVLALADSGSVAKDTLPFPFKDLSGGGDPLTDVHKSGLALKDPSNIQTKVEYNPTTGLYEVSQKMGGMDYRAPNEMTLEEYKRYNMETSMKKYWKQKTDADDENKQKVSLIPKLHVGGEMFDRIFGGNTVDIRPQGTAELIFGFNTARNQNPSIPIRQRKVTIFNFDQKIQLNVVGKIGDKLKITMNYNTEATFDFENQMKMEYTGHEDEIIKKIELGNVSMPLSGSLITGSQSLFGAKIQTQFGRLTVTNVFSQAKGQKKEVTIPPGGGQLTNFLINGDQYEANKHFFLSQYFRDEYDKALSNLPFVNSGINITRVEVWVTNNNFTVDNTRNIVAFQDLGENMGHVYAQPFITAGTTTNVLLPQNDVNSLFAKAKSNPNYRAINLINTSQGLGAYANSYNFKPTQDFEVLRARKLNTTEYTVNNKLGFVSINQQLQSDQVLAVAYQYTINGETYQVGEFSTDGIADPQALFVKLLKGTLVKVHLPIWDLMMKNVYSLGAFQVNKEDFTLNILHNDLKRGVDFNIIPEGPVNGTPLIRVLGLDKVNRQLDPQPDGVFDFIEGVTINSSTGRIFFPSVEPFGSYLKKQMLAGNPGNEPIADKYVFQQLYDSSRFVAQQLPNLNRYKLKGSYKSSSGSEISLGGLNIPQGSVTVTCGGIKLTENVDYTVDYALGRVKIINDGILNSGNGIKASYESNSMFSVQQKTMMGMRMDYKFNKDFTVGGTFIRVTERPLTQKVNIGDEPIANMIWGLDANYRTEAPAITRLVDRLPLISTKEMSTFNVTAEAAQLIPGNPKAIGKNGTAYIDDFEGSQSTIDLRSQSAWSMASTPMGQPDLFPEATNGDLSYGFNRAKLAWYVVDPLFTTNNAKTPSYIANSTALQSNNMYRSVMENEIFPNRNFQQGQQLANMPVLDLAFYPSERGPYNYNFKDLQIDGTLSKPQNRWGGIMRRLETTDFENANIQSIQFWMMDPFNKDNLNPSSTGELYVDIGDVSEDILRDGRMSFENGLPATTGTTGLTSQTIWGNVPESQPLVNAFDVDPNARPLQDVGLDGLSTSEEITFFGPAFLSHIGGNPAAIDPSADDYKYFLGSEFDNTQAGVLERYKNFNNPEGNSKITAPGDPYPTQATTIPNTEDVNKDNNLTQSEAYYQYKIKLDPQSMVVGQNFITDKVLGSGKTKDGKSVDCYWYQFKIPIRQPSKVVGDIQDFRSLRFMRIFMRGFDKPVVARFARLDLVRGEWRKYYFDLRQPGEYVENDVYGTTSFNLNAVNFEENATRTPINYVLPPGIQRQRQANSANLQLLNEQSIELSICGLGDGDARGAFRNTDFDMRMYHTLKMFVHGEQKGSAPLRDGDLHTFIRLGTDFDQNYYEYEQPLYITTGTGAIEAEKVWPEKNNFELKFTDLQAAKVARNDTVRGNHIRTNEEVFEHVLPSGNIVRVKGNPNLASVKTVMVGVRNPKKISSDDNDDGLDKCTNVWIDELRLTDFDNKGGYAATTRATVKLADLGTLTLSGTAKTPGFGSVDQKLNERSKEYNYNYDVAGQFQLGKFIPSDYNIKVPMYVGYGQGFIIPRFSPLDPDLEFKKSLQGYNKHEADSVKQITVDYTERKSLNFSNVKKDKGKNSTKSHIWDIENWSATYAYSATNKRNITTKFNNNRTYKGGLNWSYTATPKVFKPFSKMGGKSQYLKIIKEFNFSLVPSKYGFRTDLDRQYTETQGRDVSAEILNVATYNKTFTMNRAYDLHYDLCKAIGVDFTATNNGRIDEPGGKVNRKDNDSTYHAWRDSVWTNIKHGGRNTQYNQTTSINYNIPLNKIPILNFLTATTVKYTANYSWTAAPLAMKDTAGRPIDLGNIIQNSNTKSYNTSANMVMLYNKVKFLKDINQPPPKKTIKDPKLQPTYLKDKIDSLKGQLKLPKQQKIRIDSLKKDLMRTRFLLDSVKKVLKEDEPNPILVQIAKLLMSLKNVSATYSDNQGTLLPGFKYKTQIMGQNSDFKDPGFSAPGYGFVFGEQSTDFAKQAANKGWLVHTPQLNNQFTLTSAQSLNLRASMEPLKDFKIDLTATRSKTQSRASFFRWSDIEQQYVDQNPMETGTFSISSAAFKTSFVKDAKGTNKNDNFEQFLNNRQVISSRLGTNKGTGQDNDQYYSGYKANSQEVLIPAFLSAYTKTDAKTVSLGAFPTIPKPNWTVTYTGLNKMEFFKKYFKNITVGHGYRSTYSVSSFTTNLNYGDGNVRDATIGNFQSKYIINAISLSEQYSPLANVDMTWKNSFITKVEYKRDRTLNLSLTNVQLTEVRGREIVVGTGYRFKNVVIKLKFGGNPKKLKSDLNIRSDVSFRLNRTVVRQAAQDLNRVTSGQNVITLKNSIDYVVSDKLNVRFFYDRVINRPQISTSFPTQNTNAGVSLRFTITG